MKIYIVLLHYGEAEITLRCLESIGKLKRNGLQVKVILVNNNSTSEESPIKSGPPSEVITINNPRNLGFAAGMNVGIREALKDKDCSYILIVNNDTVLPRNLLIKLLETKGDIIAPVIKFRWNNHWKYDRGGKIDWNIGRTYHLESDNLTMKQFDNEKIDYVSGCCMLVKRQVFEKIGLFDTDYFFYFEDVDFCLRAKKAGFQIKMSDQATVFHKLSSSIGRWSAKAIKYNLAGNFIFINKYLGARKIIGFSYLAILAVKIICDKLWNRQKQ